jgi:hypothetical protein
MHRFTKTSMEWRIFIDRTLNHVIPGELEAKESLRAHTNCLQIANRGQDQEGCREALKDMKVSVP